MTYPTYRENKPLDPTPWALFAASGIEIDRHADPRTASEFDPRAEYEQDRKKYLHCSGSYLDPRPEYEQDESEYL